MRGRLCFYALLVLLLLFADTAGKKKKTKETKEAPSEESENERPDQPVAGAEKMNTTEPPEPPIRQRILDPDYVRDQLKTVCVTNTDQSGGEDADSDDSESSLLKIDESDLKKPLGTESAQGVHSNHSSEIDEIDLLASDEEDVQGDGKPEKDPKAKGGKEGEKVKMSSARFQGGRGRAIAQDPSLVTPMVTLSPPLKQLKKHRPTPKAPTVPKGTKPPTQNVSMSSASPHSRMGQLDVHMDSAVSSDTPSAPVLPMEVDGRTTTSSASTTTPGNVLSSPTTTRVTTPITRPRETRSVLTKQEQEATKSSNFLKKVAKCLIEIGPILQEIYPIEDVTRIAREMARSEMGNVPPSLTAPVVQPPRSGNLAGEPFFQVPTFQMPRVSGPQASSQEVTQQASQSTDQQHTVPKLATEPQKAKDPRLTTITRTYSNPRSAGTYGTVQPAQTTLRSMILARPLDTLGIQAQAIQAEEEVDTRVIMTTTRLSVQIRVPFCNLRDFWADQISQGLPPNARSTLSHFRTRLSARTSEVSRTVLGLQVVEYHGGFVATLRHTEGRPPYQVTSGNIMPTENLAFSSLAAVIAGERADLSALRLLDDEELDAPFDFQELSRMAGRNWIPYQHIMSLAEELHLHPVLPSLRDSIQNPPNFEEQPMSSSQAQNLEFQEHATVQTQVNLQEKKKVQRASRWDATDSVFTAQEPNSSPNKTEKKNQASGADDKDGSKAGSAKNVSTGQSVRSPTFSKGKGRGRSVAEQERSEEESRRRSEEESRRRVHIIDPERGPIDVTGKITPVPRLRLGESALNSDSGGWTVEKAQKDDSDAAARQLIEEAEQLKRECSQVVTRSRGAAGSRCINRGYSPMPRDRIEALPTTEAQQTRNLLQRQPSGLVVPWNCSAESAMGWEPEADPETVMAEWEQSFRFWREFQRMWEQYAERRMGPGQRRAKTIWKIKEDGADHQGRKYIADYSGPFQMDQIEHAFYSRAPAPEPHVIFRRLVDMILDDAWSRWPEIYANIVSEFPAVSEFWENIGGVQGSILRVDVATTTDRRSLECLLFLAYHQMSRQTRMADDIHRNPCWITHLYDSRAARHLLQSATGRFCPWRLIPSVITYRQLDHLMMTDPERARHLVYHLLIGERNGLPTDGTPARNVIEDVVFILGPPLQSYNRARIVDQWAFMMPFGDHALSFINAHRPFAADGWMWSAPVYRYYWMYFSWLGLVGPTGRVRNFARQASLYLRYDPRPYFNMAFGLYAQLRQMLSELGISGDFGWFTAVDSTDVLPRSRSLGRAALFSTLVHWLQHHPFLLAQGCFVDERYVFHEGIRELGISVRDYGELFHFAVRTVIQSPGMLVRGFLETLSRMSQPRDGTNFDSMEGIISALRSWVPMLEDRPHFRAKPTISQWPQMGVKKKVQPTRPELVRDLRSFRTDLSLETGLSRGPTLRAVGPDDEDREPEQEVKPEDQSGVEKAYREALRNLVPPERRQFGHQPVLRRVNPTEAEDVSTFWKQPPKGASSGAADTVLLEDSQKDAAAKITHSSDRSRKDSAGSRLAQRAGNRTSESERSRGASGRRDSGRGSQGQGAVDRSAVSHGAVSLGGVGRGAISHGAGQGAALRRSPRSQRKTTGKDTATSSSSRSRSGVRSRSDLEAERERICLEMMDVDAQLGRSTSRHSSRQDQGRGDNGRDDGRHRGGSGSHRRRSRSTSSETQHERRALKQRRGTGKDTKRDKEDPKKE